MTLKAAYIKKTFNFNFDARTSRGQMTERTSWFIKVWDVHRSDNMGIGECGPLPGLSVDHRTDYEKKLSAVLNQLKHFSSKDIVTLPLHKILPKGYPSIAFGLETALHDLSHGGRRMIFDNSFVKGSRIPINGLIWMGDS